MEQPISVTVTQEDWDTAIEETAADEEANWGNRYTCLCPVAQATKRVLQTDDEVRVSTSYATRYPKRAPGVSYRMSPELAAIVKAFDRTPLYQQTSAKFPGPVTGTLTLE